MATVKTDGRASSPFASIKHPNFTSEHPYSTARLTETNVRHLDTDLD